MLRGSPVPSNPAGTRTRFATIAAKPTTIDSPATPIPNHRCRDRVEPSSCDSKSAFSQPLAAAHEAKTAANRTAVIPNAVGLRDFENGTRHPSTTAATISKAIGKCTAIGCMRPTKRPKPVSASRVVEMEAAETSSQGVGAVPSALPNAVPGEMPGPPKTPTAARRSSPFIPST
ncbi:MAG: hypothetical protein ACO3P9_09560 [Phycisphaerales bacterium]